MNSGVWSLSAQTRRQQNQNGHLHCCSACILHANGISVVCPYVIMNTPRQWGKRVFWVHSAKFPELKTIKEKCQRETANVNKERKMCHISKRQRPIYDFYLGYGSRFSDTEKLLAHHAVSVFFLLVWRHCVVPTHGSTELMTLLTLIECFGGFEPQTKGSMGNNLINYRYGHLII